jgi:hypothetical protein
MSDAYAPSFLYHVDIGTPDTQEAEETKMIPSLMYVDYVLDEHRREARREADHFRLIQVARKARRKADSWPVGRYIASLLSRLVRDPQANVPGRTPSPLAGRHSEVPGT